MTSAWDRAVTSAWDTAMQARKLFATFGAALGLVTAACGGGLVLGFSELRLPAVFLSLLAAHAGTAWLALGRITDLQAALDMKRLALGIDFAGRSTHTLLAGDTLELRFSSGHAVVHTDRTTTLVVEMYK